jgi:hypothetical protein
VDFDFCRRCSFWNSSPAVLFLFYTVYQRAGAFIATVYQCAGAFIATVYQCAGAFIATVYQCAEIPARCLRFYVVEVSEKREKCGEVGGATFS